MVEGQAHQENAHSHDVRGETARMGRDRYLREAGRKRGLLRPDKVPDTERQPEGHAAALARGVT